MTPPLSLSSLIQRVRERQKRLGPLRTDLDVLFKESQWDERLIHEQALDSGQLADAAERLQAENAQLIAAEEMTHAGLERERARVAELEGQIATLTQMVQRFAVQRATVGDHGVFCAECKADADSPEQLEHWKGCAIFALAAPSRPDTET